MIKSIFRTSAALLCFLFLLSVGGAYATWKYATIGPTPGNLELSIPLNDFEYSPEEILPGGSNTESELGGDHYTLVDLILNTGQKGYGLNEPTGTLIHNYLNSQPVIYSNQKITGGNLKFILDPKNNTHGLYYCIQKISDTEYYSYTFSSNYLSTTVGTENEILVYKTILVKTDQWDATVSYVGYAKVRSLSDWGVNADPNTLPYSIDVETWHL
ncbi:MAG: hypothetical protein IJD35_02575 [Clostridia bacterium]|nr:hypothetical protein [Clostridia bacterium]